MKKIGVILLGIGFGVLCYVLLSYLSQQKEIVSPVEQMENNVILRQNFKNN